MTCITREEFEAKIETIETRMDARVDRIEANSREMNARMDARVDRIENRIDDMFKDNAEREKEFKAARLEQDTRIAKSIEDRDKHFKELMVERDKRLDERDAKLALLAEQSSKSAERSEGVKGNLWAGVVVILIGVFGAVYAPKVSEMVFESLGAARKTASSPHLEESKFGSINNSNTKE